MCSDSRVSKAADSLPNCHESLRALAAQVIAERDAAIAEREAAIKRDIRRPAVSNRFQVRPPFRFR
jgi:hypothetical protein